MKQSVLRAKIPLTYVKPICIAAALAGILFLAAGLWLAGLCMLLGSYILEKSSYRCPHCGRKLDMKYPLPKGSCCPFCRGGTAEIDGDFHEDGSRTAPDRGASRKTGSMV